MSRPFALVAALLCASTARAQKAGPPDTPDTWLQLRGGTDNSGFIPGRLDASWHYHSPLPVRGIAVASGMILLGAEPANAETTSPRGDQRGSITALNAATGTVLWTHPTLTWIHSDPLVYHGRVYITCGRWPMMSPGGIFAFDAHSGEPVWSYNAPAGMMPGAAIDSAAGLITAAGGDGLVITLSLANGVPIRSNGLGSADGMSSVRLDRGGVAFVGAGSVLESYSPRTGQLNWKYRPTGLRAMGDIPVSLTNDLVFTTGTRSVGIRNAFRVLPIRAFLSLVRDAVHREKLEHFRSWFHEQSLVAVSRTSGRVVWRQSLGVGLSVPRNQSGTPVVAGDKVIVSSPVSQVVWAFSTADGHTVWSRRLDAMHKGAVTVAGEDLLLGDKAGKLTILRLADGSVLGQCRAGAPFTVTAPLIVGKTVVAATLDGAVWAVPYDSLRKRVSQHESCAGT